MTKVTYTPLEDGDRLNTEVAGFKFVANIPIEIPDSATIDNVEVVHTVNDEGLPRTHTRNVKTKVLDMLRKNPYFQVEGAPAVKKRGRPPIPKNADEYKAHAQAWIAESGSTAELEAHWERELELRERLGVSDESDEVRFLRPFYDRRHAELTQQAA